MHKSTQNRKKQKLSIECLVIQKKRYTFAVENEIAEWSSW